MIALPKAISHGSNGAGTGALTALTAMSAARAEPESSASAVASKTVFFMTIPIVARSVSTSKPARHSDNRNQFPAINLRRSHLGGERKRGATAAFLGVGKMLLRRVAFQKHQATQRASRAIQRRPCREIDSRSG